MEMELPTAPFPETNILLLPGLGVALVMMKKPVIPKMLLPGKAI